jgi:hypothetical protein
MRWSLLKPILKRNLIMYSQKQINAVKIPFFLFTQAVNKVFIIIVYKKSILFQNKTHARIF